MFSFTGCYQTIKYTPSKEGLSKI